MRKGIFEFFTECPNCEKVKVKYQRPGGFSQNIELPNFKWEIINIDFIAGLPRSRR